LVSAVDENGLAEIAAYYSEKLAIHGETARGVDWNGEESQTTRFEQLCKIFDTKNQSQDNLSLNDIGCGYGALYDFLRSRNQDPSYRGVDISKAMVQAARRRHADELKAHFQVLSLPTEEADYGVASGIFNVRLNKSATEWSTYLQTTLDVINDTSRKGFAFNCLTIYSDAEKMRDYLYYAEPGPLFDLCKRRYSRHVALLHDYGLYEFTILVRKQP
jgi:SAM-dependent methyltransferase